MFSSGTSSSKPRGNINFVDWLQAIREGKWSRKVAQIRGEQDPDRKSMLKRTTLQGCTPSGVFWDRRRMDEGRRQWAVICIDIDGKEQTLDPEQVAQMVREESDTAKRVPPRPVLPKNITALAYHRSAGGNGWAVYYKYDPSKRVVDEASHKHAFGILQMRRDIS